MKLTLAVCAALIANASPALAQQAPVHSDSTATPVHPSDSTAAGTKKKSGITIRTAKPSQQISIKGKTVAGPNGVFALEKVAGDPNQLKLVFKAANGWSLDHSASITISLAGTGSIEKVEPLLIMGKAWPAENQPQAVTVHLTHTPGAAAGAVYSVKGSAGFSLCETKGKRKVCGSRRSQPFSFP